MHTRSLHEILESIDEIDRLLSLDTDRSQIALLRSQFDAGRLADVDMFVSQCDHLFGSDPNSFFLPSVYQSLRARIRANEVAKSALSVSASNRLMTEDMASLSPSDMTSTKSLSVNKDDNIKESKRSIDDPRPGSSPSGQIASLFVERPVLQVSSAPSSHSAALLRSAVMFLQRFPVSPLVPYDWPAEFPWAETLRARPDLFIVHENGDFIRASAKSGDIDQFGVSRETIPEKNKFDPFATPDPQRVALLGLSSTFRFELVGKLMMEKATAKISAIARQNPMGCHMSKYHRGLMDVGLPPIPLEWFSNIFVFDGKVRIRRYPKVLPPGSEPVPFKDSLIDFVRKARGVIPLTDLLNRMDDGLDILGRIPELFCEPEFVFPTIWVEEFIESWHNDPAVEMVPNSSTVDDAADGFGFLCKSVISALDQSKDGKIPSAHFLKWCSALNVRPRSIYQAIRREILWSHPESDLEVLIRKTPRRGIPQSLPFPINNAVIEAVRKGAVMVEKLAKDLAWGKGSDNRREYGNIRSVLEGVAELWFDPSYVYSRKKVSHLVEFPFWDAEKPSQIESSSSEWSLKRQCWETITSYLNQGPYPYDSLLAYCKSVGINEKECESWYGVFVPGSVVYLRKEMSNGIRDKDSESLISCVIYLLERLPRKACDFDLLMRALVDCGKFELEITDRFRSGILSDPMIGMLTRSFRTELSDFLFYDPKHVYSCKVADSSLQGASFDKKDSESEALRLDGEQVQETWLKQLMEN